MKSSVLILAVVIFQACICYNALALPTPDSSFFDLWVASFDPSSTPGEKNSVLCEDAPDAFYPFPDQPCSANYYACIGGVQYNQTCPNGYVYDPNIGNCLSPATATCTVTTTTVITTVPSTASTPFQCSADGFYPITSCSSSYYACVGGLLYPQNCPGNGIFDPSVSACVSPDKLPLCTTTTSTTISTTITSTTTTLAPTSTTTTLPSTPTTTPTTTTSTMSSTSTIPPTSPTTLPSTGSTAFTCTSDGFYSMGNCLETYISCVGGVAYVQTCPGNGIFVGSSCVAPESAPQCATTVTTTSAPLTTSTISTATNAPTTTAYVFTCPTPEGFFAIPGTCSPDYYVCVSGSPYVQTCPVGIFDPVLLKCVHPESASPPCTVTTVPTTTTSQTTTTTTTTTTEIPTTPFVCPGSGQYPYPGSCTLYYVCGGGTYFVASCPIGQVFNPSSHFCEDPINVPGCYFSFVDFYQGMKLVGSRDGLMQ